MTSQDIILVERLGGVAGFGGSGARLRSRGRVDLSALPDAERRAIDALFCVHDTTTGRDVPDGFRYRITRTTASGIETIEAVETMVPASLSRCVKDELA